MLSISKVLSSSRITSVKFVVKGFYYKLIYFESVYNNLLFLCRYNYIIPKRTVSHSSEKLLYLFLCLVRKY